MWEGCDEDAALAQHGVAGEGDPVGDEGEVFGCVAGRGHGLQRTEAHAVGERDVDAYAARGGQRRGPQLAQGVDGLGVVGVVVRQGDATEAAAGVDGSQDAVEVLLELGTGIDDVGGIAIDYPGIRARQGEWTGVVGAEAQHVVGGEPVDLGGGVDRGVGVRAEDELELRGHVGPAWGVLARAGVGVR